MIYRGSFSVFSTSVEVILNICLRMGVRGVFSTSVEVILGLLNKVIVKVSILHECGGDPVNNIR